MFRCHGRVCIVTQVIVENKPVKKKWYSNIEMPRKFTRFCGQFSITQFGQSLLHDSWRYSKDNTFRHGARTILAPVRFFARKAKWSFRTNFTPVLLSRSHQATGSVRLDIAVYPWFVRLQNLPWSKTGLVSRQVLHPLSKLQNWIWSKTGRYKTGLVSNTKIEASLRATKPKPWQSNLTSDTVEIFIQNEKAGLVPMQSRHGLGAGTKPVLVQQV